MVMDEERVAVMSLNMVIVMSMCLVRGMVLVVRTERVEYELVLIEIGWMSSSLMAGGGGGGAENLGTRTTV